jgi:pathogenesis-related protein 1
MASHRRSLRSLPSVVIGSFSILVACMSGCNSADEHPLVQGTAGTAGTTDPSVGGSVQGGAAQQGGSAQTGGAAQQGGSAQTGGAAQQGGSATGGRSGRATGGSATGGMASGGSTAGGTSSTVANQYVTAHNAVRSAVTQPSNYTGTWVAIPNVTWSDTIAATAQAWAENLATNQNCSLVHASGTGYGENLAMGSNLTPQQAVDMWAGEKNLYTWSATYSMADFNAGSGHYTQLVWRATTEIGCGSATCSNNRVIICCRYSPPGNYIGQAVY